MSEKNRGQIINNIFKYIFSAMIVAFAVLLLIYSKEISNAVIVSINSCLTIIVPSLFGFMVVCNFLIKSNIYVLLSKPFSPISRYLFRIPPELFSIFLLSNIGGYPIGAKMISELLKNNKITKKDADTMLCYCFCSGPAFIIGAVGIKVFANIKVGLIIYLSIFLSNFLIAIILGLKNPIPEKEKKQHEIKISAQILIDSIESTAKTLFIVCSVLIFFAVIICTFEITGIITSISRLIVNLTNMSDSYIRPLIKGFFEISTVSQLPQYCYILLPITASLVSFGGICVLLQIVGIAGKKISLKRFVFTRPFQVALSGIICYALTEIFTKEIVVSTMIRPITIKVESNSVVPGICLIIMTGLLLYDNKKMLSKYRNNKK